MRELPIEKMGLFDLVPVDPFNEETTYKIRKWECTGPNCGSKFLSFEFASLEEARAFVRKQREYIGEGCEKAR